MRYRVLAKLVGSMALAARKTGNGYTLTLGEACRGVRLCLEIGRRIGARQPSQKWRQPILDERTHYVRSSHQPKMSRASGVIRRST
jgi:hypothetical protein